MHGRKAKRGNKIGKFWDDSDCSVKKQFICTFDPGFDCPKDWEKHSGHCYHISSMLTTWTSARDTCREMQNRSDLVCLEEMGETEFVRDLSKDTAGAGHES